MGDNRMNEEEMFEELEQELSDNKMNRDIKNYANRIALYYKTLLENEEVSPQMAEELTYQYQDLILGGNTLL